MGNQKLKWTGEEEEALLAGIGKHGPGKWKNILRDPEFADQLIHRSNIDLKVSLFLFKITLFEPYIKPKTSKLRLTRDCIMYLLISA